MAFSEDSSLRTTSDSYSIANEDDGPTITPTTATVVLSPEVPTPEGESGWLTSPPSSLIVPTFDSSSETRSPSIHSTNPPVSNDSSSDQCGPESLVPSPDPSMADVAMCPLRLTTAGAATRKFCSPPVCIEHPEGSDGSPVTTARMVSVSRYVEPEVAITITDLTPPLPVAPKKNREKVSHTPRLPKRPRGTPAALLAGVDLAVATPIITEVRQLVLAVNRSTTVEQYLTMEARILKLCGPFLARCTHTALYILEQTSQVIFNRNVKARHCAAIFARLVTALAKEQTTVHTHASCPECCSTTSITPNQAPHRHRHYPVRSFRRMVLDRCEQQYASRLSLTAPIPVKFFPMLRSFHRKRHLRTMELIAELFLQHQLSGRTVCAIVTELLHALAKLVSPPPAWDNIPTAEEDGSHHKKRVGNPIYDSFVDNLLVILLTRTVRRLQIVLPEWLSTTVFNGVQTLLSTIRSLHDESPTPSGQSHPSPPPPPTRPRRQAPGTATATNIASAGHGQTQLLAVRAKTEMACHRLLRLWDPSPIGPFGPNLN